jgi:hypothetical protein
VTDVDDYDWEYDEPDPPDWGYDEPTPPRTGRERRRVARRWRHQLHIWRKTERHANDRFWRVRNPHAFDEEAPF